MGAIGMEENLEEVLAPVSDVFSVLTDINLAHSWGQTSVGSMTSLTVGSDDSLPASRRYFSPSSPKPWKE